MHCGIAITVCFALVCAGATGQEDYAAFRAAIEQSLRQHPFFSRIVFTLVDKPPFLFCVERSANDEQQYEMGIVNGYLPFLRELADQFEQHYRGPGELVRRPEAGGYALAVLSSGGRYVDFRTAIGDPSLAFARAHYTPSLRLAVTYQDTFARYNTNPEERHALLHEFVHALQHAHAANGQMPKPTWFNEGLADYRASSTNIASTLREPPLQSRHVRGLAFGYANPAGRYYVAPIADLVSANSYKDVVDLAQKRNGVAVQNETVLGMFYSQAEMFVRFLHEGEKGKHRAGFLRYLQAAQRGESGLAAFQQAFAVSTTEAMAALDAEWMRWLDGALRTQYPTMRDLTKGAKEGGSGSVPMSPPVAFDTSGLLWTAADHVERLAGVRRLCARGEYEAGLALLPEESEDVPAALRAYVQRERARVTALVGLRDDALADHIQKRGQLSVAVGAQRVRGRVLRREADAVVLLVGREESQIPLTSLTPEVLVGEGRRLKRFDATGRWLEIWTRWLKGDTLASLKGLLDLKYSTIEELKADLTGDLDDALGMGAAVLTELMRTPQVDDVEKAQASLARLQEMLKAYGKTPLLQRRKGAIELLARGLAERAFQADDMEVLGIRGQIVQGKGGMISVEYADAARAPNADFVPLTPQERESSGLIERNVAYSGTSGLLPAPAGYQLIGSTWMRWPVGLRGQQIVEMDFIVNADFVPDFGIALCAAENRLLLASPTGGVQVFDGGRDIHEPVGGGAMLIVGQKHRLRLEHDGEKTMRVSLDGKQTALVHDVGRLTGGELWLYVQSSTAVQVPRLSVAGVPSPSDPQKLRDAYVAGVLGKLWR